MTDDAVNATRLSNLVIAMCGPPIPVAWLLDLHVSINEIIPIVYMPCSSCG